MRSLDSLNYNNLILLRDKFVRGWKNEQHRLSTCFAAILHDELGNPYYRVISLARFFENIYKKFFSGEFKVETAKDLLIIGDTIFTTLRWTDTFNMTDKYTHKF